MAENSRRFIGKVTDCAVGGEQDEGGTVPA